MMNFISLYFLFTLSLWLNVIAQSSFRDSSYSNITIKWIDALLDQKIQFTHLKLKGTPAEKLTGQPVYISMTTVSKRAEKVSEIIKTIFSGSVIPTRFYLFISKEPYLIDEGYQTVPIEFVKLAAIYPISVIYTDNIGPHRKLIPLLWKKWNEDCVIVTYDDDRGAAETLSTLISTYLRSDRHSIVAVRNRRFGVCANNNHQLLQYGKWAVIRECERKEMLLLPTGIGSILYRPRFMHEIVFSKKLLELTTTADDLMFRISSIAKNVSVIMSHPNNSCTVLPKLKMKRDLTKVRAIESKNNTFHPIQVKNDRLVNQISNKNMSSYNSLFSINKKGINDITWYSLINHVDHELKLINWDDWIYNNIHERGDYCFNTKLKKNLRKLCSIEIC